MKSSDDGEVTLGAPQRFIGRTLLGMRWTTIPVVLMLVLLQPTPPLARLPSWVLLLLFAGYNGLNDLLQRRLVWLRFVMAQAVLDLFVIGGIYFLHAEPGGPFFLLFFLAVACAAATLSVRLSLLYTGVTIGMIVAVELTLVSPPGRLVQQYHIESRLALLALSGVGMTAVLRSLLLQQQAAQAARAEAQHLLHLDKLREAFVGAISHDLRTPLTAARAGLGMVRLSARPQLRQAEDDLLENVQRNIERLHLLIDDLLTLNQLTTGALHLRYHTVDLVATVINAIAVVQPLLHQKAQGVATKLPEILLIEGDGRRLEQVVVNLLANAHWHTPGGTQITVAGQQENQDVHLTVSDNGPGIAPQELEAIFQRFHRLSPTAEGSGLGLAVAKQIVELHGGRLWAESRLGAGATFHLVLTQAPTQPPG